MQLVSLGLGERGDGRFFGGGGGGGIYYLFRNSKIGGFEGGTGGQGIEGLGFSWRGMGEGEKREKRGEETYTAIFRPGTTVAVAVEARHGRLGEEGQGFAEDWVVDWISLNCMVKGCGG